MSLTKEAVITKKNMCDEITLPVKAGAVIYKGAICATDSTGFLIPATNTAGLKIFGIARNTVDNTTGANGAKKVTLTYKSRHKFTVSGASQAWVGKPIYVTDDNTVGITQTTGGLILGYCDYYISSTSIYVFVDPSVSAALELTSQVDSYQGIDIDEWKIPAGTVLTATETTGAFNIKVDGNLFTLESDVANNATQASAMHVTKSLPADYVAGTAVTLRIPLKLFGAGTDNGSTIDAEVFLQDAGALGSDLCTTAAQTVTTSYVDYDFTIPGTGLTPGGRLKIVVTASVVESATADLQAEIDGVQLIYKRTAKEV